MSKILSFIDNTTNQSSKFRAKILLEVSDDAPGSCQGLF